MPHGAQGRKSDGVFLEARWLAGRSHSLGCDNVQRMQGKKMQQQRSCFLRVHEELLAVFVVASGGVSAARRC